MSVSSWRLNPAPTRLEAFEDRVGRHHAADMRGKRAKERANVVLEILSGERREASVVTVAVEAVLRRAVANPVLDDGHDAARIEPCGTVLESRHVRAHE